MVKTSWVWILPVMCPSTSPLWWNHASKWRQCYFSGLKSKWMQRRRWCDDAWSNGTLIEFTFENEGRLTKVYISLRLRIPLAHKDIGTITRFLKSCVDLLFKTDCINLHHFWNKFSFILSPKGFISRKRFLKISSEPSKMVLIVREMILEIKIFVRKLKIASF